MAHMKLLLHGSFYLLLLLVIPATSNCNVDPEPTRPGIARVTSTVCGSTEIFLHRKIQVREFPEPAGEQSRHVSQNYRETLKKGSVFGLVALAGLAFWLANVVTSTAPEDSNPQDGILHASSSAAEPAFPDLGSVRVFSIQELKQMTNNFGYPLGVGGFGKVYRGHIDIPSYCQVAVKKTTSLLNAKLIKIFNAEKETLSKARHENVVRLIGYCTERNQRFLVYELVSGRDLYRHIHPKKNSRQIPELLLSWKLKLKVLLDAAQGLEYLHQRAEPHIIHRDIKSKNILVDENWVAKLSDFGFSVFGPQAGSNYVQVDVPGGTDEYMDPEYSENPMRSAPSNDVYSFGVVMLEVLSGHETDVVRSTVPKIKTGLLVEVLDGRSAKPEESEMKAISMVAELATQCVNLPGIERPDATCIVSVLQSALELLH